MTSTASSGRWELAKIPRRCRLDLLSPVELTLAEAHDAVEAVGCDARLTDAVVLIGQARDRLADYYDDILGGEAPDA